MILVQFMEEVKFVQSWIFWGFMRTVDSKLEQMAANGTLRDTVRQDNRISCLFVFFNTTKFSVANLMLACF